MGFFELDLQGCWWQWKNLWWVTKRKEALLC